MPTPQFQPVPAFNFSVSMWDEPSFGFGDPVLGGLGTAASLLLDTASSFVFGGFQECQGLDVQLELEEYRAGGDNTAARQFKKHGGYPPLVFKKGVTSSTAIWDWVHQVVDGNEPPKRKSGIVMLLERGGFNATELGLPFADRMPVATWLFRRALPKQVQGPQLNATSNAIAIETLELAHEGLRRLSLSSIPGLADVGAALGGLASVYGTSLTGLGQFAPTQTGR